MTARIFLTIAFFAHLGLHSETLSAQNIDGDAFTEELSAIAEKASLPGVYKGKIAIEFANYFNSMIERHPIETVKINALTNRVADAYSIKFTLNGKIMESAQFPARAPATDPTEPNPDSTKAKPEIVLEPVAKSVQVYTLAENRARFPGCEEMDISRQERDDCAQMKMHKYIYENQKYPEQALSNGVEGTVKVRFDVQRDGRVTGITVVQSLGYGCDEESVRIIESMNHMDKRWSPGTQRDKKIIMRFTQPILFKLQ